MLLLLYAYLSIVIPFFNLFYACRTSRPSAIEERPRYLFIRTAPITFRLPNHAHFFKLTSRLKETLRNVRNLSVLSSLKPVEKTWRITVFLVFGLFFFFLAFPNIRILTKKAYRSDFHLINPRRHQNCCFPIVDLKPLLR